MLAVSRQDGVAVLGIRRSVPIHPLEDGPKQSVLPYDSVGFRVRCVRLLRMDLRLDAYSV